MAPAKSPVRRNDHHPAIQLARAAIEAYVHSGRRLAPADAPAPIDGEPAGVFVTLHGQTSRELRGCIGTIAPSETSLAQEIINNAISAAARDPRFPPVQAAELADLEIEVSILHPPEHITSLAELQPSEYGVIVERGRRRGLLLPGIEGIDDAETQVRYARIKAGIGPHEPVDLLRFRVDRFV